MSWNVRGANDREKRKLIKDVIKTQKADLVCLQETKLQEMTSAIVRSLGVGRCLEWGALNSRGAVGGWWCSGTIGCCSWRKWRWAIIQFLAVSRMLRMVFDGRFQEFMGPL